MVISPWGDDRKAHRLQSRQRTRRPGRRCDEDDTSDTRNATTTAALILGADVCGIDVALECGLLKIVDEGLRDDEGLRGDFGRAHVSHDDTAVVTATSTQCLRGSVFVRRVHEGSRAEMAGLRAGDIVAYVNGARLQDGVDDLRRWLRRTAATEGVSHC